MKETWKNRFDKLTYSLIYPAFIGNMIYDLLLRKLSWLDGTLTSYNLWTCITIVFFLLIDFMHLHGDMDKIVPDPKKKTWRYILIDIATSILIFLSFVFIKEGKIELGLLSFTIIPLGILWYKWKNIMARKYFLYYFLTSLFFSTIIALTCNSQSYPLCVFLYSLGSTIVYLYFITFYYIKKCKSKDIELMKLSDAKY